MKGILWIFSFFLLVPLAPAAETNVFSPLLQTNTIQFKGAFLGLSKTNFLKILPKAIPLKKKSPLTSSYAIEDTNSPPGIVLFKFYKDRLCSIGIQYSPEDLEKIGGLSPVQDRLLAKLGPPLVKDACSDLPAERGTVNLVCLGWTSAPPKVACRFHAYISPTGGTNASLLLLLNDVRSEVDAAENLPKKPADVGF